MDDRRLIDQTLTSILEDFCTPERNEEHDGLMDEKLWSSLAGAGLTLVGIPEDLGGSGGDLVMASRIVRKVASFAAQVPVADSAMLSAWLRSKAGLPISTDPETVVLLRGGLEARDRLSGDVRAVPWSSACHSLLLVGVYEDGSAVVRETDRQSVDVIPSPNIAGEAHGDIAVLGLETRGCPRVPPDVVEELVQRQALSRALMISGAMDTVLSLAVTYATERRQFGRPISSFQALRQQLAILAGETVAASVSAEVATLALASGHGAIASHSARVRCAQAATMGARVAHQVHGAIGFTREHRLHHFTRRLWAWRDELGTERSYREALGKILSDRGPAELWPAVVR